ncbi:hypothetical protein [Acholeplasma hippikon]|uniref:Uncharacterized protein n=1 Tax=Acholeplasma hippikon TaxID=264636 RepID=A0A449BJZ2_9MOLU|nr:hypothetical protein [Acholeplasma hippikon]VEU82769.1 Uncharacterised protein [Acholeplasma hippikon]
MAKRKSSYQPDLYGTLDKFEYQGSKLIKKERLNDQKLNVDHWKFNSKFDKSLGAKSTIRKNFDYKVGQEAITSYTTRFGDRKVVYKRDFSQPIIKVNK